MALLKILHLPDPRLREKAWPIEKIDAEIHRLIDDMFETMYDAPGVGLAATQVGSAQRLAVIDVSQERNDRLVLINPEIIEKRDEKWMEEGCLSVPYHTDKLKRATWVKMRALDQNGKQYELEATNLLAECIQHEIDHLDGKLYIDYLSPLKRNRIIAKIKKIQRERKDL